MSALPRSLAFYFSSMALARNRHRIRPVANAVAAPGDCIVFDLPPVMCDLDTFSMSFKVDTNFSDGTKHASHYCVLGQNAETVIEQISVEQQGLTIDNGVSNTNRIYNFLLDWTVNNTHYGIRSALHNGFRPKAVVTDYENGDKVYHIKNWLGWLGSVQPRKFDVSLLGNLRVTIRLANNKAFIADSVDPKIEFKDFTAYVDTLELLDGGLLHQATQSRLAKAPLECPFDKYYYTQGAPETTGQQTLVANINTNSLDYVAGGFIIGAAFGAGAIPHEAFPVDASGNVDAVLQFANRPRYLVNGLGTGGVLNTSQFSVLATPYPTWPATVDEAFVQTIEAMGADKDGATAWLNDRSLYTTSAMTHVVPFTFPGAEPELRLKSGLNTLGNPSAIQWTTDLASIGTPAPRKYIIAKTTAILRVGSLKQAEVVL